MKQSLVVCIFFLMLQIHFSFGVKKVDCYSDPLVCTDPVCKLTALSRNSKSGIYGCTPVQPADKLWIRITQFKKTSDNVFMPGNFDITQNACDVLNRNSTAYTFVKMVVNNVDPDGFEPYNKVLHACPYTEKWMIQLMHDTEPKKIVLASPDEYKVRIHVFNEKNQTFYEVNVCYF